MKMDTKIRLLFAVMFLAALGTLVSAGSVWWGIGMGYMHPVWLAVCEGVFVTVIGFSLIINAIRGLLNPIKYL